MAAVVGAVWYLRKRATQNQGTTKPSTTRSAFKFPEPTKQSGLPRNSKSSNNKKKNKAKKRAEKAQKKAEKYVEDCFVMYSLVCLTMYTFDCAGKRYRLVRGRESKRMVKRLHQLSTIHISIRLAEILSFQLTKSQVFLLLM